MSALAANNLEARASVSWGALISWYLLPIGAIVAVIFGTAWTAKIVYALATDAAVPQNLYNNSDRPGLFAAHAFAGTTALFVGTLQMLSPLRNARPDVHRRFGKIYFVLAMIAAITSFGLAPRLYIFGVGELRVLAGALWAAFTILGVLAIRSGRVSSHRRWMLRSFALAYMGVTFVVLKSIARGMGVPLEIRYPAIIWLSFLINVLTVEMILWKTRATAGLYSSYSLTRFMHQP